MKPSFLFISLLILSLTPSVGQDRGKSALVAHLSANGIFINVLGVGYEAYKDLKRLGLGIQPAAIVIYSPEGQVLIGGRLSGSLITGKKNHHLELGLGVLAAQTVTNTGGGWLENRVLFPIWEMGYRYQPPQARHFFRSFVSVNGLMIGFGVGKMLK